MGVARPFARSAAGDASARKPYDLIDEPTGDAYRGLVKGALSQCDTAALRIPAGERPPALTQFLESLRPHFRGDLPGDSGGVVRFTLDSASAELLAHAVDSLYAWRAPDLPENLVILRRDGTPWLMSMSAQRLGYIEVTSFEKLLLGRAAPTLPPLLIHRAARDAILAVFERRFEEQLEVLTAELVRYGQSVIDEGRDGLVDTLGAWMDSGIPSRVEVAIDVVAELGLDELLGDLQSLAAREAMGETGVPPVLENTPPLRDRWIARHRDRITRARVRLGDTPEPDPGRSAQASD